MRKLVKNLRFRKANNKFQRILAKDLKDIQLLNNTLTATDKKSNTHRPSKEEYSDLLQNAITSKYEKTDKHKTANMKCKRSKHH